jgi:hypothetical protein
MSDLPRPRHIPTLPIGKKTPKYAVVLLVAGFDFGCSAKYSVGRVDTRNPRRTPLTVGNRMVG